MVNIEMRDGKSGRATGVLVLCNNGRILGGDSYFYYAGNGAIRNGKWRGELVSHQHSKAVGKNLAFGGREVSCRNSPAHTRMAKRKLTGLRWLARQACHFTQSSP